MSVGVLTLPSNSWWEEIDGKSTLLASECAQCGSLDFPPSTTCYKCGEYAEDVLQVPLSRIGRLYSYSVMHVAPPEFATPYVVGYVDHSEGIRVLAQIHADPAHLVLGCELEVATGVISSTSGEALESYCYVLPAAREQDGE